MAAAMFDVKAIKHWSIIYFRIWSMRMATTEEYEGSVYLQKVCILQVLCLNTCMFYTKSNDES